MFNVKESIEQAMESGYQGDYAVAKVCQDIVLKTLTYAMRIVIM